MYSPQFTFRSMQDAKKAARLRAEINLACAALIVGCVAILIAFNQ